MGIWLRVWVRTNTSAEHIHAQSCLLDLGIFCLCLCHPWCSIPQAVGAQLGPPQAEWAALVEVTHLQPPEATRASCTSAAPGLDAK